MKKYLDSTPFMIGVAFIIIMAIAGIKKIGTIPTMEMFTTVDVFRVTGFLSILFVLGIHAGKNIK